MSRSDEHIGDRYSSVDDSIADLNRAQFESETDSFTPHRYEQFAQLIGEDASAVLDVGCNTGRGGVILRRHLPRARLEGVEILAERVALIPNGIYEEVHLSRLEDCPMSDAFDAIVMGELIEHVPLVEVDTFLRSTIRLLRPGGALLLTTPNPHYILIGRRSKGSVLGGPHVSVHCAAALSQYLRYVGFDIETVRGTGRVSLKLGSRLPLFLYGSYMLVARKPLG